MGIINIWGALANYFTSKFRQDNPNLTLKTTLYAFPLTYVAASVAM
jgi:hypothetical protein